MKNKKLFQKVVFIALIALILFSLVAPAIFSQSTDAPKQEKLLNELKVLMWSDAKADKVALTLRIHAGSAFDPQGKEGVMQMLADNIFPNEASREFFAEDLGGSLEVVTNYDFIEIRASSKPDGFLQMLETVAAAVSNPVIDKETTGKLRDALLAKIALLENDPVYVADHAAARRLFGTFPYGRPTMGTAASVGSIGFPDLIDAKQRFLSADNATVAISGNFDRALGFRAIRRFFGSWIKSDKRIPSTFRQPDPPPAGLLSIPSPKGDAAAIRFISRGLARNDKALPASMIFTAILESRLKARVPASHSGDISVRNLFHTLPGAIMIGFSISRDEFGTGNGKVDANELVGKAINDPISDAEFIAAKDAVQSDLANRTSVQLWLDLDTYKTAGAEADRAATKNVSLADVNAYAVVFRKQPMASVLVNTPPATK